MAGKVGWRAPEASFVTKNIPQHFAQTDDPSLSH
jgi:hypothetical protein